MRLKGLQARPELNGQEGTVEAFLSEKGRFRVKLAKAHFARCRLVAFHGLLIIRHSYFYRVWIPYVEPRKAG